MKVLILYCHPYDGSYNHAILESVCRGLDKSHTPYEVLDLVKDGFDPVMRAHDLKGYSKGQWADPKVGKYQEKMEQATSLVIITPIWWGTIPAVLKGFFDKVFIDHWAYELTKRGFFRGLLKHFKSAVIISTMNAPKLAYNLYLGNPLKHSLIRVTLKMCGIKRIKWFEFPRVVYVSREKRVKWLDKIERYFEKNG